MRFRFRKLYADLVSEDGAVCIVYVSRLDAWGLRARQAAIELYRPDGTREIVSARRAPRLDLERLGSNLRLELDVPEGPFRLCFEPEAGPWEPAMGLRGLRGLRWRVLCARARAVGVWPRGHRDPLHGVGYADLVALDHPPRRLGLERLDWGRVHLERETIVFTRLSTRRGLVWGRAARWRRGAWRPEEGDATLEPDARGLALRLADGRATPARLYLRPERTLHDGSAFDPVRIPSPFTRALTMALAGRVDEARWLSRADGDVPEGGARGSALHERVDFATARARPRDPTAREPSLTPA